MSIEEIQERQEKIDALVDHLLSGKCKPSDLLQEDCYDLVDMIVMILSGKAQGRSFQDFVDNCLEQRISIL